MRVVTASYSVGPKWRSVASVHSVTNQGPNKLYVSTDGGQTSRMLKAGNALRLGQNAVDVLLYAPGDTVAVCEQDDTY